MKRVSLILALSILFRFSLAEGVTVTIYPGVGTWVQGNANTQVEDPFSLVGAGLQEPEDVAGSFGFSLQASGTNYGVGTSTFGIGPHRRRQQYFVLAEFRGVDGEPQPSAISIQVQTLHYGYAAVGVSAKLDGVGAAATAKGTVEYDVARFAQATAATGVAPELHEVSESDSFREYVPLPWGGGWWLPVYRHIGSEEYPITLKRIPDSETSYGGALGDQNMIGVLSGIASIEGTLTCPAPPPGLSLARHALGDGAVSVVTVIKTKARLEGTL